MKNLLIQARAVTDPIKNPLIGWWIEYYIFYVKHRDLASRTEFENMMLDPSWSMANVDQPALVAKTYHAGGGIDWAQHCLQRVTEVFFRPDGVAYSSPHMVDGMPLAQVSSGNNALDSLTLDTAMVSADVEVEGADANTTIQASEIDAAMRQWSMLREAGMTNMGYEDYLATYGVRPKPEELHEPELIRMVREWQYPSNTIDPTDGSATSAVSWAVADRADKDRFFREPGFIFGVCVVRPKVYLGRQYGSVAGYMTSALNWLPAMMQDDAYASWKKFTDAGLSGPLSGHLTGDYWLDIRDLFLHGEQFANFDLATATDANNPALPTTAGAWRYAASTDIDALFVNAAGGFNLVRQDGVVSLSIASSMRDTSPTLSSRV